MGFTSFFRVYGYSLLLKRTMDLGTFLVVLREPDVLRVREERFWMSGGRDTTPFPWVPEASGKQPQAHNKELSLWSVL